MDGVVVLGWEIKSTNGALVCSYTYVCKEAARVIYNQRDWRAFERSGSAAFRPANWKNAVYKNPHPLNTLQYLTFTPIYACKKNMQKFFSKQYFSFWDFNSFSCTACQMHVQTAELILPVKHLQYSR